MEQDVWFEAININCFKKETRVVKNLNLKLRKSENILLLGPNGSGKSSLIDLINRNIYPLVGNDKVLKMKLGSLRI